MVADSLDRLSRYFAEGGHLVAQQPFSLLNSTLEVSDRIHLAQVYADGDQRLGNLRRQAGHDDGGPQQPRRLYSLYEVIRHRGIHSRDTRDVDHHDLGTVGSNASQQLFGQLPGTLGIDHTDDRQDEKAFADLEYRRGEFPDRFLLLANDALALLDKAHGHRIRNTVRRRFVRVEDAVQQLEVRLVFREERTGEHIAQEQYDPHDLIGFHPSRDDAFRQITGVGLQRLDGAGFQHLHVVIIDRCGFGENFLAGHRPQQLGRRDTPSPLLTELRSVFSKVV